MPRVAINRRFSLYVILNAAFALVVGVAYAAGGFPNPRLLHLILLFALCSSVAIDIDRLNGPYALLGLFMLVYFVSYGVGDLSDLFRGGNPALAFSSRLTGNILSKTEVVILLAGIMLVLGYRVAVLTVNAGPAVRSPRDWSKHTILIVGSI